MMRDLGGYLAGIGAFLARSDRAPADPVAVAIEPTNRCNLRCPLCAAGAGELTRQMGSMSPERFTAILDGLPRSVSTVYLWGQGEPFLAPGLTDMIAAASGRGMRVIVSTNGHFLDDAAGIASCGLSKLIVSLDGIDAESYAAYRVGGDFDRVTAGVRRVSEQKARRGGGPLIELQCLATRGNVGNLHELRAFGALLGADRLVCKTLQAAWLPGGEDMLPDDLRLTRYRRRADGALETDRWPLVGRRCLRLYYSAQIDCQGNVVPCCFDKDSDHVLGNAAETPFGDIWNGEAYRSFRDTMNRLGRHLPMCADCSEGAKRMYVHV